MGILILLITGLVLFFGCYAVFSSFIVRISGWTKSYQLLAKRYGSQVGFSGFRPKLTFLYGRTTCKLRNLGRSSSECTQLQLAWPNRKYRLLITNSGQPKGFFNKSAMFEVDVKDAAFSVFTNQESVARDMLNGATLWKIKQLIDLRGTGAEIAIENGKFRITKPGFIKQAIYLDDFVRFGLELFDQFKLAINHDLEFVSDSEAVVISEVTCPICSGQIIENMVTCVRCKTPHCADCWEYNGQCATFACNEKRFFDVNANATAVVEQQDV